MRLTQPHDLEEHRMLTAAQKLNTTDLGPQSVLNIKLRLTYKDP